MAEYKSRYTGSQIDARLAKVTEIESATTDLALKVGSLSVHNGAMCITFEHHEE